MRFKRILQFLACLWFTFHVFATAAWNLPLGSYLVDPLTHATQSYLLFIRHFQNWRTFITIPYIHSFTVEILAKDKSGREERFGPVLPGLKPYDDHVRTALFFLNADYAHKRAFPDYAQRLCSAISQARTDGFQPDTVSIVEKYSVTRKMNRIREDGRIADAESFVYGPYDCGALYDKI